MLVIAVLRSRASWILNNIGDNRDVLGVKLWALTIIFPVKLATMEHKKTNKVFMRFIVIPKILYLEEYYGMKNKEAVVNKMIEESK